MYYDLLSQLKNAANAKKETIYLPFSKFDFAVAKALEGAKFVKSAEKRMMGKKNMLEVRLRYDVDGHPAFTDFKIVSKPSRHLYRGYGDLKAVRQSYGIAVLSTSGGVMSNRDARKAKVGGEYLFEIW